MNKRVISKSGFGVLAITSLMLLPSCGVIDWVKDKMGSGKSMSSNESSVAADGSAEVASIGGKPLITEKRLQKEKKDLIESNPQLKAMINYMDGKQFDRNLTEGLVNQEVVDRYVADNKINQTSEYQQEYERMMKSVRQMLNTKHFSQAFNVAISDTDVQKFYDEHKTDMPNIVVSRGGTKAMGVMFETEQAAKDFMSKAKASKDFKKVAKEAGLTDKVKDFNLVNDQSLGMEPAVREKVVAMKSFPSVDMVKARDKAFWVVTATGKEDAKYREFEQVKAELTEHMKRERRMEVFEAEIKKLKDQYQIAINEEYFKEAAQPAEAMAESTEAKAEPVMQQASTEAAAANPESAPASEAKVA